MLVDINFISTAIKIDCKSGMSLRAFIVIGQICLALDDVECAGTPDNYCGYEQTQALHTITDTGVSSVLIHINNN